MRDLLLQHGANENNKDRGRWELRKHADVAENIQEATNYKNIDKDYNPWPANEMDFLESGRNTKMHARDITSSRRDSI